MQRVLYVSESCIKQSDATAVVSEIVAHARRHNSEVGVTGALIFTGQHFVQVLEGPLHSVELAMTKISVDPRHRNLVVVEKSSNQGRQFSDFQMAYKGSSLFVARQVTLYLHASTQLEREFKAEYLTTLTSEFIKSALMQGT